MGSYEKEIERLRVLMEEVLTDQEDNVMNDDDEDDSDHDEVDHVEEQCERSDAEQEISDVDEQDVSVSNSLSFSGKDKTTRWNKRPCFAKTVRIRRENLVKLLPGSVSDTKVVF